jgi:PAS domain S-box-containing protein
MNGLSEVLGEQIWNKCHISILDKFPSMIFIADRTGSCIYFNHQWLEFTGRKMEQELGKGFTAGVFLEDLENCMKIFTENFSKNIFFVMEFRLKNVEGKYRWIQSNCMPFFDESGVFNGYIGGCFDIQDIKDSEEKNRKFSRAVEQSPLSIVITDIKGNIEYVNPKFTEISGYTFEEAVGNTPKLLKSGRHDANFYSNLWSTILSGNTWQGEMYNLKKDGTLFIEEASINPVKSRDGKVTNFVAIKQDITKRKADEEELKNKNFELERFNKMAVDRELKMIELKKEISKLKSLLENVDKRVIEEYNEIIFDVTENDKK